MRWRRAAAASCARSAGVGEDELLATDLVIGEHEEFTRAAVGAMIASGVADAGFGVEEAAAQYGLAFVPPAVERYFLAMRESSAALPPARALLKALESRWFRALHSYSPPATVGLQTAREALGSSFG